MSGNSDITNIQLPADGRTLILTGPTASGKTGAAIDLALRQGGVEIVNADSLLVYRGMDIGTAKPTLEERQGVPHHLIDIIDPNQEFTAAGFRTQALNAIRDIQGRRHQAIVVGGTGFYLKALLFGIWNAPKADPVLREKLAQVANADLHAELLARDPRAATRIGPNDRYRLIRAVEILRLTGQTPTELEQSQNTQADSSMELVVLDREDSVLEARIRARTRQMIEAGIVEEYRRIHSEFGAVRPLQAVGYREVGMYIEGRPPEGRKLRPGLDGLEDEINLATRQLVKTQRTFFKNLLTRMGQSSD